MHIVNPPGVKFTNKYLTWFRCLGLEDHGLGEGTNGGQESGKQCKAVPTLRKQADSVYTEPACFMLVGALPQSPQNTQTVFWNDG